MSTERLQQEIITLLDNDATTAQIIFDAVARAAASIPFEAGTHKADKEVKDGLGKIAKALSQFHLRAVGDKVKRARGQRALETLKRKIDSDGQSHWGREWLHLREEAAMRGGNILSAVLELEQAILDDTLPHTPDPETVKQVADLARSTGEQIDTSRGGPGNAREPNKGPRTAILFHVARAAAKAGIPVTRDGRFCDLATVAYTMAGIKTDPENDIRQMMAM